MTPTTTPEAAALLVAVLEQPGDDLPRLVMADWYEENGEADRAAFIRHQCGVAPLTGTWAANIVRRHKDEWCSPLTPRVVVQRGRPCQYPRDGLYWVSTITRIPDVNMACRCEVGFRRGFPEELIVSSWVGAMAFIETMLSQWPVRRIWVTQIAHLLFTQDERDRMKWEVEFTRTLLNSEGTVRRFDSRAELVAGVNPWLRDMHTRYVA